MREPRFRAWIERYKKYMPVAMIHFEPILGKIDYIEVVATGGDWAKFYPEEYILEQYTGLKDKNGKEIYEGDIVKLGEDSYEVLFDSYGQFCIENKKLHWTKDCFSFNSVDVWNSKRDELLVKVIGNIHENPELLEEGE